ncbi:MAG TPA: hypothetical protein VFA95_11550 [Gammaproteobacteria bacterium]|nr:hypothetical protein [Gammaproteobacteria bacterium]
MSNKSSLGPLFAGAFAAAGAWMFLRWLFRPATEEFRWMAHESRCEETRYGAFRIQRELKRKRRKRRNT